MERTSLFYFKNLISLVILGNIVIAQALEPKKPLTINVSYSRFALSPDTGYVEVSYLFNPSGVTLEKEQDTLRGTVVFHTVVKHTLGDTSIIRSLLAVPLVITDTALINNGIIWKSFFTLPVGTYELNILGYDFRNAANRDSVQRSFVIEKKDQKPWVSDIDICTRIENSQNRKSSFYKNSYEVVPNPTLLFGGKKAPVVFSYAEIYNLNHDSAYSVVIGLLDVKGKFIKKKKQIHKYQISNVVDVGYINIAAIPSGKYSYVLIVADTLDHEIARSEKLIYIHNPHLESQTSDIVFPKSAEFAGMANDELVEEFRKVRYIASTDDIKVFEKLSTAEAKRGFLSKFWNDIESGKIEGKKDITRIAYLDRVRTADQRYRVMGREGWHTDRGRVYILNGEPDEIDRHPSSDEGKPYEVWHYYQIENGIQFVFVDRSGYGEYMLVHSTKRGELQDEQWERNLR